MLVVDVVVLRRNVCLLVAARAGIHVGAASLHSLFPMAGILGLATALRAAITIIKTVLALK